MMNVALIVLGLVAVLLVYAFLRHTFVPGVDPVRHDNPGDLVSDVIQVEVRNGCGVEGLAADTRAFLRRRGFDVVAVGDFDRFDEEHSFVIDRVGNTAAAERVADALGIPRDRIRKEVRLDLYLDATIVLGKDYDHLTPFAGRPPR